MEIFGFILGSFLACLCYFVGMLMFYAPVMMAYAEAKQAARVKQKTMFGFFANPIMWPYFLGFIVLFIPPFLFVGLDIKTASLSVGWLYFMYCIFSKPNPN